mmetsp:Transcript_23369/g.39063  ORF Transcript_23369/g.39063 Transcript_23369/m.39063 type:complete len:212 (+) Transcript_23369:357-992(+)
MMEGYVNTYVITYVSDVNTSHTPEEGAHSPRWKNGVSIIIICCSGSHHHHPILCAHHHPHAHHHAHHHRAHHHPILRTHNHPILRAHPPEWQTGTVTHLPFSKVLENCSGSGCSTMSSSGPAPGTSTFTSEDFAVVMAACFDVSERYSWQPSTLSSTMVGTLLEHCTSMLWQFTTSHAATTSSKTTPVLEHLSMAMPLTLPLTWMTLFLQL